MPVISWLVYCIQGMGGQEEAGVGGGGKWEAKGRAKQPFGCKQQCCTIDN